MSQHVNQRVADRVMTLTLNRPKAKNALTGAMYTALADGLDAAKAADDVRVVVIEGEGDAFCAGNDLGDFMNHPPEDDNSPVFRFLHTLSTFPGPVIVAVQGHAVGIGTTMLLHADLAVADTTAKFKMPFVQLALVPEAASSLLVPGMVGHRRAFELLVLGRTFGADEAKAYGFVNEVAPEGGAGEAAQRFAAQLAALPPEAIRQSKALMKRSTGAAVAETIGVEGSIFRQRLASDEVKEALSAFFEKRRPDFSRFS